MSKEGGGSFYSLGNMEDVDNMILFIMEIKFEVGLNWEKGCAFIMYVKMYL